MGLSQPTCILLLSWVRVDEFVPLLSVKQTYVSRAQSPWLQLPEFLLYFFYASGLSNVLAVSG